VCNTRWKCLRRLTALTKLLCAATDSTERSVVSSSGCSSCNRSRKSAAVVLLICAMTGLAAVHGFELAAQNLARAGDHTAAVTVLDGNDLGGAGLVLLLLIIGFAVLDAAGLPLISHIVALVGGGTVAYAVLVDYHRGRPGALWLPRPAGRSTRTRRATRAPHDRASTRRAMPRVRAVLGRLPDMGGWRSGRCPQPPNRS